MGIVSLNDLPKDIRILGTRICPFITSTQKHVCLFAQRYIRPGLQIISNLFFLFLLPIFYFIQFPHWSREHGRTWNHTIIVIVMRAPMHIYIYITFLHSIFCRISDSTERQLNTHSLLRHPHSISFAIFGIARRLSARNSPSSYREHTHIEVPRRNYIRMHKCTISTSICSREDI